MLDIQLLRHNLAEVVASLTRRHFLLDIDLFTRLENKRKSLQCCTEKLQAERNRLSKIIGQLLAKKEDVTEMKLEVVKISEEYHICQQKLDDLVEELKTFLASIPNMPDPSVPEGKSSDDNVECLQKGVPKDFLFSVRDHVDIGERLQGIDFDIAAQLSGARFVVLGGGVARLHRALVQFMLDLHVQHHGYKEMYVPYLVRGAALFGTGQLPRFEEDLFNIERSEGEENLYLIPTAEVPLSNLVRDRILSIEALPLRYVAHTPCFRAEAGSYGRDTRGMIRQHQFEKVELVHIVHPDEGHSALEELTIHARAVLDKLELPYRVMSLCAGDMGFSACQTYDLEVWLPSQKAYREISSCSHCGTFQARRLHARFRSGNDKPQLVHTLNGSGLAVGRTLVAILENYQEEDGSVTIPACLHPYMSGLTRLEAIKK